MPNFLFLVTAAIFVGGGLSDTILKGDHPRTIPLKFGSNWPVVLEELIKMQNANDRRTTDAQW